MTIQEFLEKHLSNYHSDDRVATLDDLHKELFDDVIEKGFSVCLYEYYTELQDKLFSEALENYTNSMRK